MTLAQTPTSSPTVTRPGQPTDLPTVSPTDLPTVAPTIFLTPTNPPTASKPGQPTDLPTVAPTELPSTAAPSLMPRPTVQPTSVYAPSRSPTRFAQTELSGALIFLAIVLFLGFCAFFAGLLWYFCGPKKPDASDEIMRSDSIFLMTSRCFTSSLKFLHKLKEIPLLKLKFLKLIP